MPIMNCSTFSVRGIGLGIALFGTVTAVLGCGGGDSADKSATSGAGGSAGQPAGNAGGSAKAGDTSAGAAGDADGGSSSAGSGGSSSAGSGGKPSGGGGNAGSGGSTAGAPTWSGNFDDCDPPEEGLEHCSTDNPDHAGTSVCTEYYTAGYGKVFCADKAMTGPCPRGNTLYAICVNQSSTYQYDDSKADAPIFFQAFPRICDAQAGTWCGPR